MKPGIEIRPARWKLVMIACSLALLMAGCGSGGGASSGNTPPAAASSSTTPSPSDSVLCANAAALRASLDKLRHVKVGSGTVTEIMADLTEVKAALVTFVDDAHSQWQAQTSSLNSALAKLKTAASNLAANPSTSTVSGALAALGDVNTAAQDLLAAANTRCPSASPAPST